MIEVPCGSSIVFNNERRFSIPGLTDDVLSNMKEMVGGCCVCSDERGWPDNPLVYCDGNGCTVAVHQACYGIVTVPTGPWFCRKCENPENKGKVRCELCPSKSGALKRADSGGWAHVVCALYIPEVRFGNVTSMEPIVLRLIPQERYNKTCYICQESGKGSRASAGACMQCNKSGCRQQFHVTCAQSLGLLCEEAGNYLDNVKYCGYCQHHYSKLKKGGNVKTIPPYKPVSHDSQSSDSSGEKEGDAMESGSNTPPHASKQKPGRKVHSGGGGINKNVPNAPKASSTQVTPTEKGKKPSPSRRSSGASDAAGGSGSKNSTPAPSPQHGSQSPYNKGAGGSEPGTSRDAPASVISSAPPTPATISSMTTSVVQGPKVSQQETVITNTDAVETKHTKKRKAMAAANAAIEYPSMAAPTTEPSGSSSSAWDMHHATPDVAMENVEKIVKKPKTESNDGAGPSSQPPSLPPSLPSPRATAGPSGLGQTNMRSPSQMQGGQGGQGGKPEREAPLSLLVSVPLPPSGLGLKLSPHAHRSQMSAPSTSSEGTSHGGSHMFHQLQKQVGMEQGAVAGRSAWGGLNVSYEMQQDPGKQGPSGVGKQIMEANVRNKKRAALTASASMPSPAPPAGPSNIQSTSSQMMSGQRRMPLQPTPIYQETIKDSPPSSPGSEKPLKPKMETKMGSSPLQMPAPHMLGNALNPESDAAARLQEQLSAELAAHAVAAPSHHVFVPPPLFNKAQCVLGMTAGPSGSGCRSTTSSAQSLDQLLERQWEQGSQFLMEQAQHFDIASLLSCLHQLRTENVRLEEHVGGLLQRRDHLLAVNARLAIPLTAHHPVTSGTVETSRPPRDSGSMRPPPPVSADRSHQMRPPPPPVRADGMPADRAHQMMVREVQQKPS